jgi:hypothetical protein
LQIEDVEDDWRWWWVRTCQAIHKSMWQCFWILRVKTTDDDDEWETVKPFTSPCDSVSGYWGLSSKKPV